MPKIWFLIVLLVLASFAKSQNCKVKLKNISDTYEGDCEKGVANGNGTAKGVDSYTGDFKNGLPSGQGRYQWANGDWYDGSWEKGVRAGYGTMHYADKPSYDTLYGFWKKDKYVSRFEEPYIVHYRTNSIHNVHIEQEKTSSLREITIYVESITGGARQISGATIVKPKVNSIEIIKGLYVQQFDQDLTIKRTVTTLRMVQFPFRARYVIGNDVFDLEILEEGKWEIELKLQL